MAKGITVWILGDYGPFSRTGKSIGYQVTIGETCYLIDCGSPIFQQLGGHGLKSIEGLIITHCHDDHKRWFSDLALFNMYAPDVSHKVPLFTTEVINKELIRASGPALEKSLSSDSKRIVDISYDDYIKLKMLGPEEKYRIVSNFDENGKSSLYVADGNGKPVGPDRAKIIISKKSGSYRLLFKDPDYNEWVEPESFYPFSSNVFYSEDKNICEGPGGLTIEAIKSPVWHGISCIGVKFKTESESLVFSSDTVHDIELWKQLCSEKRDQQSSSPKNNFESASIIFGDINDYIERTWSEERFKDAVGVFEDAIIIHDIAIRNSVVHTDYRKLKNTVLKQDKVILTHAPDVMTSEWVLSNAGKSYKIEGDAFFEMVGDKQYILNADIYHKEDGKYYVGYKKTNGSHQVYEEDRVLTLSLNNEQNMGTPVYRVDLYEDIEGGYHPMLNDNNSTYQQRADGKVELVKITEDASSGKVVTSCRNRLI